MKALNEDIKNGQFKNVYLLYGEESFLRRNYRDRLKKSIIGDDDMNYTYYEGKGINVKALIDMCEVLPFFNDKRLIIIENSGFFESENDALAEYVSNIPEYLYIVFVEEKPKKTSKLFKSVNKKGSCVLLDPPNEDTLIRWCLGILGKSGKKITKNGIKVFLDTVDNNMDNMYRELQKLISYVGEREGITPSDVEAICTVKVENKIFDMINYVSAKKKAQALMLYKDLITLKEQPIKILVLLNRQFNILLQIKELYNMSLPVMEIAQRAHLRDFVVKKNISIASKLSVDFLKNAVKKLAQADEDIKMGRIADSIAVELLITELSENK